MNGNWRWGAALVAAATAQVAGAQTSTPVPGTPTLAPMSGLWSLTSATRPRTTDWACAVKENSSRQ